MANRIVPYTIKEKLLLANLIDKYKLVENKKTDAATIQKKNEEWAKIAEEYNCRGDIITQNRNFNQLRKLWNNLKQRKRKAGTELKYQRLATGGGPEPHVEIDPVMQAVDVAAPYADVTLECQWDSTAIFENENLNSSATLEIITIPENTTSNLDTPNTSITQQNSASTITTKTQQNSASTITNNNASVSNNILKNSTTNSSSKNSRLANLNTEAGLRIKKMQDAIQQQEDFHNVRMRIEEEQLKTAVATKDKVEAERELAVLQLKLFKSKNNIE